MWLENQQVYHEQPQDTATWCTHFVNCIKAHIHFLLNLNFQLKMHLKTSNCILTLHINVHHCRYFSTSVVCSALVISSLSSVDVSDVQWVFLDVLIRRDICPHFSRIRITCSRNTVLFHIVTFYDVFIFNLLHRCWD